MEKNFNNFNKKIKQIFNLLTPEFDDIIFFDNIKQKVFLASSSNPAFLLQEVGPEIFKYRDDIKNKNYDSLLKLIVNICSQPDLIKNDRKEILDCVNRINTIWNDYDEEEKNDLHKIFLNLLSEYCQYLKNKKL